MPGKSHGRRSLVGYSPWSHQESDAIEQLHFHFSLSRTGEGTGNPLQYSCLENHRDRGAWWTAVYRVALGQTRLKQLSSISTDFHNSKKRNRIKYPLTDKEHLQQITYLIVKIKSFKTNASIIALTS